MSSDRVDLIRNRLSGAFAPSVLNIIDESAKHAGHASARGGGHFRVEIVAEAFAGKTLIQRHRMVYDALGEELQKNEIHALSIRASTPAEAAS